MRQPPARPPVRAQARAYRAVPCQSLLRLFPELLLLSLRNVSSGTSTKMHEPLRRAFHVAVSQMEFGFSDPALRIGGVAATGRATGAAGGREFSGRRERGADCRLRHAAWSAGQGPDEGRLSRARRLGA